MQAKRWLSFLLCLCLVLSTVGGALAVSAAPDDSMPNPDVYLDFEDGTGADVNGNVTATLGSSVTIAESGKTGNKSASFTNVKSMNGMVYWEVDDYNPLAETRTTGATISMWVNQESMVNDTYFFSYGWYGYRFYIGYNGNTFKVSIRNNDANPTVDLACAAGNTAFNGQWALLTVTFDPNKVCTIYINGEVAASDSIFYTPYDIARQVEKQNRANAAWIGYYAIGGAPYWPTNSNPTMLVDDFALYTQSLSAPQVKALYDASAQPTAAAADVAAEINALHPAAGDAAALAAIQKAEADYNALSDSDKAFVDEPAIREAYNTYYNAVADANGGKLAELTFEDGSYDEALDRAAVTAGSSVTIADTGKFGSKSAQITSTSSSASMISWHADAYDPFLYTADGTTISMWVNLKEIPTTAGYLFSYGLWGFRFYIGFLSNNRLEVSVRNEKLSWATQSMTADASLLTANTWTLVTLTCDADRVWTLYLNDTAVGQAQLDYTPWDIAQAGSTAPTRTHNDAGQYDNIYSIGHVHYWGNANPNGYVDDMIIYNKVLTAGEIYQRYTNTAVPTEGAAAVVAKINALSGASDLAAALEEVQAAYDALSPAEQELVSNYGRYLYYAAAVKVDALTTATVGYQPSYLDILDAAAEAVETAKAAGQDVSDLEALVDAAEQAYETAKAAYDATLTRLDNKTVVSNITGPNAGTTNGERVEMLFDSSLTTKMGTNQTTCIVTWQTDALYTVGAYGMVTGTDSAQWTKRSPIGWKLEGSADGVTWETMDEIFDSGMGDVNNTEYKFYLENPGAYQYFRVTFKGDHGAGFLQLDEIWLYLDANQDIQVDDAKVQAVVNAIDVIQVTEEKSCIQAIQAAEAAYGQLNSLEKLEVSNYSKLAQYRKDYAQAVTAAQNGQSIYLDFEDGTVDDVADRVSITQGSAASIVEAGANGAKSLSTQNTNSMNSMVYWEADDYDPFEETENTGITISMWVKLDANSSNAALFSYGWWGYRFFVSLSGENLEISTRNNDGDPTSAMQVLNVKSELTEWAQLTVTCDTNRVWTVYINGARKASQQLVYAPYDIASKRETKETRASIAWTSFYALGGTPFWTTNPNISMQLDDFALYNQALNYGQVLQLYDPDADYDAAAVQQVVDAINALPDTEDSGFPAALRAVQAAYNALNPYEQADVTNADVLESALAALAQQYPAAILGFQGEDVQNAVVEGDTVLVLLRSGADSSKAAAAPVLAAGCTVTPASTGTMDLSQPVTLHVSQIYGEEQDYTVMAYSAANVTALDKVESAPVQKLIAQLPAKVYRNQLDIAKEAVEAYTALTDLQKLLLSDTQRVVDAAARVEELENSPIRITCVGSSCTEGSGSSNNATKSYPAQMGQMLGDGFVITNAGRGGTTVVNNPPSGVGVYSYMTVEQWQQGLQSEPDIMIMFVGSNDATNGRWNVDGYKEAFIRDYKIIMETYMALPSHPYVFISYPYQSSDGDRHQYIPEIMEIIDDLQVEYNCGLIDFYTITEQLFQEQNNGGTKYWTDGVHPNDAGYERIAEVAKDAILEYLSGLDAAAAATGIQVDGVALPGFDPNTNIYTLDCQNGGIPQITATVPDGFTVKVTQATLTNPVATVYVEAAYCDYGASYEVYMENLGNDMDQEAAQAVIQAIEALGSVPASADVAAARAAYDALTDAQKTLVTNYDLLLAAEQAVQPPEVGLKGDLNGDGVLSVTDVVLLRKAILNQDTVAQEPAGDMNSDGALSVTDVVLLRKAILNQGRE